MPGDLAALARWRRSVGPPVVVTAAPLEPRSNHLVVVNWNTHVGGGDIDRLFSEVSRGAGPDTPLVFLLQEAYREGPEVPRVLDRHASFAGLIRSTRREGTREEIETVATSLGLHAYYVPSMRNGGPPSDEDRGNAILSTVPLQDLSAIELPFERQRRVAVAATVRGRTLDGRPWSLRVLSAHLDNMPGWRRLWVAGAELGRLRQVRGLLAAVDGERPLVLGADLNTWFGFRDSAYLAVARALPQGDVIDRRATFRGLLRLDHLFFRLDPGWRATSRRADDDYGSDHYPLIGTIEFGES
jgi:endonuclease/exonuclease/phosphatase family metal-dependent hydrolase